MTLDEITKRVIVPDTGLDLNAELEAVWRRAVNAALSLALKPLTDCDEEDRETAFLAWCSAGNGLDVERVETRLGETFPQLAGIGRLPRVQRIYDRLRKAGPGPAQRVLIAYANLLCSNKHVPIVKEIQNEIRRDGKARCERYRVPEHSSVRFILERARLPMTRPGWPKKKQ